MVESHLIELFLSVVPGIGEPKLTAEELVEILDKKVRLHPWTLDSRPAR